MGSDIHGIPLPSSINQIRFSPFFTPPPRVSDSASSLRQSKHKEVKCENYTWRRVKVNSLFIRDGCLCDVFAEQELCSWSSTVNRLAKPGYVFSKRAHGLSLKKRVGIPSFMAISDSQPQRLHHLLWTGDLWQFC